MKKKLSKLMIVASGLFLNAVAVFAQAPTGFENYQDAREKLNAALSGLSDSVAPIFNVASAILGIIFVIYLVWNISQQQKGNDHAQDSLMKVGGGLLGAILLLQVIKILFFK